MNIAPFLNALKARLNDHKREVGLTYFGHYDVIATEGPKYFKVYACEVTEGTTRHSSIKAFVDKQTGDIFKPASFNAPAKHSRGNVLSAQNGMEAITPEGFVAYLK